MADHCSMCGALMEDPAGSCPYSVPLDRAPGIGDPDALAGGRESHSDHEVYIARWRVHHPEAKGATPKVMAWARERLAREGHLVPPT